MDIQNNIDALDEALKLIFLENPKESNVSSLEKEVEQLLSFSPVKTMAANKMALLIQKLNVVATSLTFGQLFQQALKKENLAEESIAEKIKLPIDVILELKMDNVYTNNIPIVLFRNLLSTLNLSFKSVETAIRKTFEVLQNQVEPRQSNLSGFSPAFRKGFYTSRESFSKNSHKTDGKELFENKEALEKYLIRLNELMNN